MNLVIATMFLILVFVTNLNEYYSLFDVQIYTSLNEGIKIK